MTRPLSLLATVALAISPPLISRESPSPTEGLHDSAPRVHALTGATVVVSPDKTIENATVVIRDGLIESVGANIDTPDDARVWDLTGKTLYAGFIDAYTNFGIAKEESKKTGATYWNPLVTPERDASKLFAANAKEAEKLNNLGFATVATYPGQGIFRGQGALVNLNGKPINQSSVQPKIAQHIAFEQASRNGPNPYPGSLMGTIALIRQALYDANWHADLAEAYQKNPNKVERPVENIALSNLQPLVNGNQFALFQAWDELDYQRIETIADEFKIDFAILGNGYEYRRASILKDIGATLIIPLEFPETPKVERADTSLDFSLEQLQHWEFAPSNPAFLAKNDIPFCLTSHFFSDPAKGFWKSLRSAVKRGLSSSDALAALTTTPAQLYDIDDRLATIEAGKIANIVVSTGDLFTDDKAKVSAMWIDGDYIEKNEARAIDLKGKWDFTWTDVDGFDSGKITGDGKKLSLSADKSKMQIAVNERELLLFVNEKQLGRDSENDIASLRGYAETDRISGTGQNADGTIFTWSATRSSDNEESEDDKKPDDPDKSEEDSDDKETDIPALAFNRYPAGAFGVEYQESPDTILVKNATIWTSGPKGNLDNADLLIKNGRISKIGKSLKPPKGAIGIDASGKHVTAGLIDCHSHMAMSRGVNEAGSAISVEVRAADIVNPVQINIYRQLAGGLTAANLLHGSANPMGGQSQVIKLRWGEDAEAMKFEGARPGVKFALGENVKQSNWGDRFTTRYPQTRMGVEQFMVSYFRAAEDYERKWKDYQAGRSPTPPRKNIRLEAALEILKAERDVHIHSYRQDEILMFARLAKKLGLRVAAFQHILEGYKVADAMVEINAGGSTFSDWWAYKFEVFDAIPYNGVMMHNAGVLTSFNSDDAELATRMNTEAAKAVKYGGLSEQEALKFVTLNPAIQLGIDDRVGSLEVGKDADFVIWSDHPLSTYAHAEQTWVDGIKRFDKVEHAERAEADDQERRALIQKALAARIKQIGLAPSTPKPDKEEDKESEEKPENDPPKFLWMYHDGLHHYSCSGSEEGHHH